ASSPSLAPCASRPEPASKEERLQNREADKQRQKEERARQRQMAELEAAIEAEETALAALEERLADPALASDYEALQAAGSEHERLTGRIADLYAQWERLHGAA
ncbi:MAG TPA: ABC transporter ATP-binding protein, partial [Geobacteraceae bacterium]